MFVGKPSFLHNTEDIDWVPTKNLESLGLNVPRPSDSSKTIIISFSSIVAKIIILLQWLGFLFSDVTASSTYTAERNEPIDEEPIDLTLPRISVSYSSIFLNVNESIDESSIADGPLQSKFIEQS